MIEIICDVEGCNTREILKGKDKLVPSMGIPAGWYQIISTVDELGAKRQQEREAKVSRMSISPAAEFMGMGRMPAVFKKVLCPKHPLPMFKPVADEENELEVFGG